MSNSSLVAIRVPRTDSELRSCCWLVMVLAMWTRESICCAVIVMTTRSALYDCSPARDNGLIPQPDLSRRAKYSKHHEYRKISDKYPRIRSGGSEGQALPRSMAKRSF